MNMDPGTWSARVAAEIRTEMATQRRTRRDLAAVLGVTEPTAAQRLDAEIPFDLVELERVAAWLGLPVSRLLARVDGPTA